MNKKRDKKKSFVKKLKVFFLAFVAILSFIYTIKFLDQINLKVDDLFLSTLVSKSNNIKGKGFSSNVVSYVIDLDFFNPVNLLKNNYRGLV